MNHLTDQDGFIIRPVHVDDAQAMNEIASHPKVARALLQLPSKEIIQTESLLQQHNPGLHRLIAEITGFVAGAVTLSQPQNPRRAHSGELGLMVHPNHWGKGAGTALISAILELADNWLNLKRVALTVLAGNSVAITCTKNSALNQRASKE